MAPETRSTRPIAREPLLTVERESPLAADDVIPGSGGHASAMASVGLAAAYVAFNVVALLAAALVAVYLAGIIPSGMLGTLLTLAVAIGLLAVAPVVARRGFTGALDAVEGRGATDVADAVADVADAVADSPGPGEGLVADGSGERR